MVIDVGIYVLAYKDPLEYKAIGNEDYTNVFLITFKWNADVTIDNRMWPVAVLQIRYKEDIDNMGIII